MHEHRDRWSLDLDDHVLTAQQSGSVHLRDRGRGERFAFERREHGIERGAQLGLDDCLHVVERLGRHLVPQLLELADQLLGEQPFTAADDLAELDVGGTESFGRHPKPSGQITLRIAATASSPVQHPPDDGDADVAEHGEHTRPRRQQSRRDEFGEPFAHSPAHGRDLVPPAHLLGTDDPGAFVAERADGQIVGRVLGWHRRSGHRGAKCTARTVQSMRRSVFASVCSNRSLHMPCSMLVVDA